MSDRHYYCYVIFNLASKPLYVGKGKGSRCMEHLQRPEFDGMQGLQIQVRFVESEQAALDLEEHMIAKYGRENLLNKVGGAKRDKSPFKMRYETHRFILELENQWPKHLEHKEDPVKWAEKFNSIVMAWVYRLKDSQSSFRVDNGEKHWADHWRSKYYTIYDKIMELTSAHKGWRSEVAVEIRKIAIRKLREERRNLESLYDEPENFRLKLRKQAFTDWQSALWMMTNYMRVKPVLPAYRMNCCNTELFSALVEYLESRNSKRKPIKRAPRNKVSGVATLY
jgi:hypothetical protein